MSQIDNTSICMSCMCMHKQTLNSTKPVLITLVIFYQVSESKPWMTWNTKLQLVCLVFPCINRHSTISGLCCVLFSLKFHYIDGTKITWLWWTDVGFNWIFPWTARGLGDRGNHRHRNRSRGRMRHIITINMRIQLSWYFIYCMWT